MSVERILSRSGIVVILLTAFVPVYFPLMAKYEGRAFPVVSNVVVVGEIGSDCPECRLPHVDILLTFDKVRQCEFVNLSWFDETGRSVRVEYDPKYDREAQTRPTGSQVAGPWRVFGVGSLEGTRAVVEHKCHPFYRTYTQFYP